MSSGASEQIVTVGRVAGLFGVSGWLRIYSYTQPRENILGYGEWYLAAGGQWQPASLEQGQRQGKGVVAKLAGIDGRDQARQWLGSTIAVARSALPEPEAGEYYWVDLEGLRVRTVDGAELGVVDHLFATGANDVLVVRGERERLVPFVLDEVVERVDSQAGVIEVDWDPEF